MTRNGVNEQVVPGAVPKLERLLSLWRVNLDLAAQAAVYRIAHKHSSACKKIALVCCSDSTTYCSSRSRRAERLRHLTIVPYGILHYLPFHCLFDGVQFVVERLNVSYLPAAALLDLCRQRGKRIKAKQIPLSNSLVMGLSDNGRLAFARQEAEAVAKLLGAPCALNEAATTTLLREVGANSPIVHIAAHGMFRLDAPNFSHIKLADRQLSTIEVFNLDLSSCSLVTLSACETGRAIVGGVDEVIGLGTRLPLRWRGFTAAHALEGR